MGSYHILTLSYCDRQWLVCISMIFPKFWELHSHQHHRKWIRVDHFTDHLDNFANSSSLRLVLVKYRHIFPHRPKVHGYWVLVPAKKHWKILWKGPHYCDDYNGLDGVSNHQPHECWLNRSFGCRSKKTSKLRVTRLCAGNSPETGEFPAQMASNAENAFIRWRHHVSPVGNMICHRNASIIFHVHAVSSYAL